MDKIDWKTTEWPNHRTIVEKISPDFSSQIRKASGLGTPQCLIRSNHKKTMLPLQHRRGVTHLAIMERELTGKTERVGFLEAVNDRDPLLKKLREVHQGDARTALTEDWVNFAGIIQQCSGGVKSPVTDGATVKLLSAMSVDIFKGIPKIIPVHHRRLMVKDDDRAIMLTRLYLCLFSLYRVIPAVGKPDYASVTDPFVPVEEGEESILAAQFMRALKAREWCQDIGFSLPPLILGYQHRLSWASGPNSVRGEPAPLSIYIDALAFLPLTLFGSKWQALLGAIFISPRILFPTIGPVVSGTTTRLRNFKSEVAKSAKHDETLSRGDLAHLGRVGLVFEPALKVRQFYMLDSFRQSFLAPFHEWCYDILAAIPQDGTYNQVGPLKGIVGRSRNFFCYDLSSATDRFPRRVQEAFWSSLFGPLVSQFWSHLIACAPIIPGEGPCGG